MVWIQSFGKIAYSISSLESDETPLQVKMRELSKVLSILVVVIAAIMFVIGLIQGKEIVDVFMLAIALAVAAIPEGLAAVITITLSIGVQKMASKKAIVRKLSAVEALGSTSVICSDKTGTLTQNKMTVRKIFKDNKVSELKCDDILSKIAVLCNDTRVSIENNNRKLLGDPTETALIDFYDNFNIKKELYDTLYERVEELPFDSIRKLMTTVNKIDGKYMTCTKGAIESILDNCDSILIDNKVYKLNENYINNIKENNKIFSDKALRVLGFAYRIDDKLNLNENNLIFAGMIGMIDPPRDEAKAAVNECYLAGMIPVMITGDNINTATAIAKELNILKENDLAITGEDLDKLSDDELRNKINNIKVYARVSPENKIRIVKMFKSIGKIVAMTGDGVNDAPALKGADIGIGMGITGTEVSKSVSSIVLSDDNFATIVVAVKEGRRIYTNIQNVIVYLLASNLAEVLIIVLSMLFGKELLFPIQILWINLVTDTIPAIALGFEKEEKDIMNKKPRDNKEKFFTKFLTLRIAIPAVIKALIVFGIYGYISNMYDSVIGAGAAFVTLASIEILFSCVCRSSNKSIFEIGIFSNIPMLLCVVFTLLLQVIILAIPSLRVLLQVPHIPMNVYYIIICTVI
ncbi:MAG: cation-translocating P-type ATPase, partial [Clostridia bacterium]